MAARANSNAIESYKVLDALDELKDLNPEVHLDRSSENQPHAPEYFQIFLSDSLVATVYNRNRYRSLALEFDGNPYAIVDVDFVNKNHIDRLICVLDKLTNRRIMLEGLDLTVYCKI